MQAEAVRELLHTTAQMESVEYGVPILCSSLLPLQFLLVSYHAVRRIHLIANCPYNPLLLTAFQKSY